MVTAAFTIFFELELFFIRILAIARWLRRFAGRMAGAALGETRSR
jgi:hypothetical protein